MNLHKHEQFAKKIQEGTYEFAESWTKLPRKSNSVNGMNLQKHEQNCQENTAVQIWICRSMNKIAKKILQCKYEYAQEWRISISSFSANQNFYICEHHYQESFSTNNNLQMC